MLFNFSVQLSWIVSPEHDSGMGGTLRSFSVFRVISARIWSS